MADVVAEQTDFVVPTVDTVVSDRSIVEPTSFITTLVSDFPQQTVVQKVWDTVAGDWVLWATEAMDIDGASYPGPGTWGAHTSDYRVLNIKFTRVQE